MTPLSQHPLHRQRRRINARCRPLSPAKTGMTPAEMGGGKKLLFGSITDVVLIRAIEVDVVLLFKTNIQSRHADNDRKK